VTRLTIITGPDRGRTIELPDDGTPIVLGRQSSDIVLPDPAVSRKHAELCFDGRRWTAKDLDSSNGTFVNEQKVAEQLELAGNDQIRCGITVLLFESTQPPEQARKRPDSVASTPTDKGCETMVGSTSGSLVSKTSARRHRQAAQAGLAALNRSHAIKNLLQALAGSREVLDHAFKIRDMDRAQRGWGVLNSNLDQINRLVLDLLKLSHDSSPNLTDCDLNALLRQIVETARQQAEKKNILLGLQLDPNIDSVALDADRIAEAVLNVILNAIDAVDPDKGKIAVATQADSPDNQVIIKISDNGPGIEDTKVIFEPFHTTNLKKGTGLGLPITKKIIEEHNGKIHVESTTGNGAIFTIQLPIKPNTSDK
jgi:signal transduction histidine kinase